MVVSEVESYLNSTMGKRKQSNPQKDYGAKRARVMYVTPAYKKRVQARLPELKEITAFPSASLYGGTTANGTTLSLINAISEGSDSTNRIGRKITHAYLDIKVQIKSTGVSSVADAGFWAVVLDRQVNGALPAFSDVYDTTSVTTVGLSPKNTLLYQDRFQILATDTWAVNTVSGAGAPYMCHRYIDMSKLSGRDKTCQFNGSGATIGDINTGAVYFICADTSGGATTGSTVTAGIKYRFYDM